MALEIIKSIHEVEKESEEIYKSSLEEAREISKLTEKEIMDLILKMQEEAQLDARQKLSLAEKEAKEEIEILMKKNDEDCDKIKALGSNNLDQATSLIMERIVNSLGNR